MLDASFPYTISGNESHATIELGADPEFTRDLFSYIANSSIRDVSTNMEGFKELLLETSCFHVTRTHSLSGWHLTLTSE